MANSSKIAFVTGGNRGVGLETARELGKRGITVLLGARDAAKGEEAAAKLRKEGITVDVIVHDAGKPESDKKAFDQISAKYGKLDILVNNAGTLQEELLANDASRVSEKVVRETFDTNFFAVIRLTQTLLPLLRKSDAGRIVNVSSILGSLSLHANPASPIAGAKALAYNASKAALNAFTIHLAAELAGTSIKVNSGHPGWVKTELGGPAASDEIEGSGRTSAYLATLPADGPTGGFFHKEERLPW